MTDAQGAQWHRDLSPEEHATAWAQAQAGLRTLAVRAEAPPARVVHALYEWVEAFRTGRRKTVSDLEAVALRLGYAYGQQFVRAFAWQWAAWQSPEAGAQYVVLAPNASRIAQPLHLFYTLLVLPAYPNTVLLNFDMLSAGNLPTAEAASYTPLERSLGMRDP